ncbi:hypothetical protein [Mesorhizobium sp. 1B3]|uniref:CHASE3 domain-containing protein n=1 Tax=Mesorhizobium sp. 1B3 TaxID=3243599 RepID=UPI003D9701CE
MGVRWGSTRRAGRKKTPGITRRDFLGGAAVAPIITATANLALGAVPPDQDSWADLIFILSDDERIVAVRRVSPDTSVIHRDWTLEVASFGPDAWFDMHPEEYANWDSNAQALKTEDGALRRQLTVRGASWGRHVKDARDQPLEMTFVFERRDDEPWTVGIETNVWPSEGGNPARLHLHTFIASKATLDEILSQGRIQSALSPMFDGQLTVTDQMTVGLNADLEWVLSPLDADSRPILAFDGCAEAPAVKKGDKGTGLFALKWEKRPGEPAGSGRRLTARSLARWAAAFEVIGNLEAPSVTVAPPPPPEDDPTLVDTLGDLFIGQLDPQSRVVIEGGVDSASVVALFAAPSAVLDCRLPVDAETPVPTCASLPLDDVTVTRMAQGASGEWRDVIVADAGGKRVALPGGPPQAESEKPVPPPEQPASARVATLIGRIDVAPLPIDAAASQVAEDEDPAMAARRKFDAITAAALGDRAGVAERTFFLLADRGVGEQPAGTNGAKAKGGGAAEPRDALRRLYADVALRGIDAALPDTRDSSLTVAGSHFRLNFLDGSPLPNLLVPEVHWNTPDGFLWLGAPTMSGEFAWLDLGGTTVHARRDYDLVDVRFRFSDFVLGFSVYTDESGSPIGIGRSLRPSTPDARQIVVRKQLQEPGEVDDGTLDAGDVIVDRRPVLAVEFPPQHVMEEAFYRQELGPLPDIDWPKDEGDLESFLEKLRLEPDPAKRAKARMTIGKAKEASEQADQPKPFASLRAELAKNLDLPVDQQQYFGPYAMSPEAITAARAWQTRESEALLKPIVARMLAEAAKNPPPNAAAGELGDVLLAEADAEKIYPLYKLWRDAFRAYVIETRGSPSDGITDAPGATFAEYVNRLRHNVLPAYLPSEDLERQFTSAFLKQISGREPYDRLAMARLSGRSLLSFRVNFEAAPGDSLEVNGLPGHATDSPIAPGPGVQRFGTMPFTFAALTDWSRHEPHVTQRARKLYEPLASGAIPPAAGRVASVDDHAVLVQQGFERGQKSSEAHLGQVRANLSKRPKGLETRIEIPARLILSTAQNAIWQAPRKVSRDAAEVSEPEVFDTDPPTPGNGYEAYEPLWTTRLITEDAEPGLRAVWSPDMRPEAIGPFPEGVVLRIAGPPPRGPWSPWILRREHVDGVRASPLTIWKIEQAQKPTDANAPPPPTYTDEDVCLLERNPTSSMFQRICEIFRLRANYNKQADLHTFRTSLDAYDRHELVLLSSAYGLPATGRRRQIGPLDTDFGDLVEKSGQFEPGEDFVLTDVTSDLAYYRPKPLDVSELSLSALGGFLNHDTNFLPQAPAVTYDGRSLFDGLSIERWQHLIVLGRDVLATVVYSGYLYPLGHKASLVKITERIFVRMKGDGVQDKDFGVKAVLRQRMFIRVSSPTKKYPAVGQPNKGRQWCAEDVTMLTRESPDIVDPTLELDTSQSRQSLSGRIFLDNRPGLAFWPQTATTEEARFRFEFTLDGRRTKMPLIFVDRIAAKDKAALDALLKYYRALDEDTWRTAQLNGQTLRFAEPVKEGDTSFAVDSIVFDVDGRASNDGESWEGRNDLRNNTGVLEGADQPPFYPAMSSARIHIEQAECMSGVAMGAARVRFDGSYVLRGLPRRREEAQAPSGQEADILAGNAAEVFLYVDMAAPPKMSMGPNGNQSGGVGRPNMDIVALSRSKGILGAQPGQAIYRGKPSETAKPYSASPMLLSVANHFSLPAPQPQPPGDGPPPVPPADEGTVSKVFESFFSVDAKLLGVISFQSLMKLLKLVGGVDAMPALKEVVDYGSQALANLQQGAAGAIELLHSEILAPLLQLVRTARKEWSKLDRSQTGAQESVIGEFQGVLPSLKATSLRKLYPEIDHGLSKLETALLEAMGEKDPILILERLAAVHEAGRQFMRELGRLAANPVERIEQAARGQFDTVAGDIEAQIRVYETAATDFVSALQATKEDIARELLIYLADELPWYEIEALIAISKSGEEIYELSTKALKELRAVDVDLKDIVSRLASGGIDPRAALAEIAAKFLDGAIKRAEEVEAGLRNPSLAQQFLDLFSTHSAQNREIVASAVAAYRLRLVVAKAQIAKWIDQVPSTPEWAIWVARIRAIVQLIELLRELVKAAEAERPERVFALLVQLGRDYLNIDLLAFRAEIENEIALREAQLRVWVEAILARLVQVAAGTAAANTQINPELPATVTAACVAQLPVNDKQQAEAVAAIIDGLSPQHFLEGFAITTRDTFDLATDLTEAQSKLPADISAKPVRDAITDFQKALPAYRRLFCEVVAVVGHAQAAHRELTALSKGTGTPPVMTPGDMLKVADRLRVLAGEVEKGLGRIRNEAKSLLDLLDNHLGVIILAAAGGAFAAAFGNDLKAKLNQWDKGAAAALRIALNTLFRWTKVVASVGVPEVGQLLDLAARIVRERIPDVLRTERDALEAALEKVDDECRELAAKISTLTLPPAPADETVKQLLATTVQDTTTTVQQLFEDGKEIARTDRIEKALQDVSATYAALVGRAKGLPESLAGQALDAPVEQLFKGIQSAYKEILRVRDDLVRTAHDYRVAGPVVQRALTVEPFVSPCNDFNTNCDKLAREKAAVDSLLMPAAAPNIVSTKRAELQAFLDSISDGRSAVEQIFDNIQEIWADISRGELSSLVDIAALRDQVEELISELVPMKRTLSYSLGFDFDADKIARTTGGVFTPKPPSRFELAMTATIGLVNVKADMNAKGRIGPFDVKLIGSVFNAVTLIFDGVDFGFELGGSPRFDVHYRDFKIGEKLEFVKKLQSYMTPSKDGSGFFIEPMRGRPGILAGYGINLGTIQLGGVAFSNVLLNAAAELPFDGEAAMFRFALGRAMAPFLISVPPCYGGGGFVAIYADCQGFRGIEASFEFGGVANYSTGPLVAQGRLTSGFYIRSLKVESEGKRRTLTDIYGTFFVGGEASIWIFSFYASLYVRLGMKSGGEMEGEATFTFSFSMGIVDYDFQVSVSHKREAFGGGGTNSIGASSGRSNGVDRSVITRSIKAGSALPAKATAPNVEADTTPFGETTVADYLAYFDPELL